jgi:hypothetical protein
MPTPHRLQRILLLRERRDHGVRRLIAVIDCDRSPRNPSIVI